LEDHTHKLRRNFDKLKSITDAKQSELKKLSDKLAELDGEGSSKKVTSEADSPMTKQIRNLENRLDKAMIKYNEAQSIKKTYEQIVKRLQDERLGFDNQLAALERTLKAKQHDFEELMMMSHDAQHAKEVAKAELQKYEQQMAEEKRMREKELAERKALLQSKVEQAQRLEQKAKEKREKQLQAEGDLDKEGEDDLRATVTSNVVLQTRAEGKAEEEQAKITTYEEAFRKIKDATGVADVNEVIQKFLTQEDTHKNLLQLKSEASARIESLTEEKSTAKTKVEEIKYSGSGSMGSRRIVDEFETHLSEANAKCERNRQKYERIAKILINVKAGIEHLADKLDAVVLEGFDSEHPVIADENVAGVLDNCGNKLVQILQLGGGSGAEAQDQSTAPNTDSSADVTANEVLSTARESEMPAFNIRIKLPGEDVDDSEDSDEDEDAEDEVPDRESMKKQAGLVLDKATKKKKGRRTGTKKAGKGSKSRGGRDMD
jgi:coiled-coil domain-containing protein 151